MARFFTEQIDGDTAVIIEDAPHIAKTLRMKPGDEIIAMDGLGGEFVCRLRDISPKRVLADIDERRQAEGEAGVDITIYQGVCRSHRFEYVVQKCTELGAKRIVPLLLRRCETKAYSQAKRERFQKIAREAAKQSGRGVLPAITENATLEEALQAGHDLLLCPYEEERKAKLREALSGTYQSIGIIIGPEGGLEREEVDAMRAAGGWVVTLGRRILRTETVAPVLLGIVQYEMDEL